MKTIALQRLHLLSAPSGDGLSARSRLVLHSELAMLGYRISNLENLENISETIFLDWQGALKTLAQARGGDVSYVPLFLKFPDDCPDDDAYFAKRVLGYLGNDLGLFSGEPSLEDGSLVPAWLFDLEEFGADPISQMQDRSLWQKAKDTLSRRKDDTHVEWIDLELVTDTEVSERLRAWAEACLYAKSSIKEALHGDLGACLKYLGTSEIDTDRIAMKENLALLMRLLWQGEQYDEVKRCAKTPTDILRLCAALTGSDVSLSKAISFPRFSRKQRKVVLSVLESSSDLGADMKRYKGLWKALGRGLHPGEYKKAFPLAAAAFENLRNGTIVTYAGETEALLEHGKLAPLLKHLNNRPGVFARKLHELLRGFEGQRSAVLSAFEEIASGLPVKNLLVLMSYFGFINDAEFRTIINKKGNIKVLDNNSQGALKETTLARLRDLIEAALVHKLAEKESWQGKRVWIDPVLKGYTVPLAQRAASDGLLTFGRGSRIPVDCKKVLRLFVYWKQTVRTTDLDLSALQLDDNFGYIGHVSYTNLSDKGIAHSGDIQSAPAGGAEFIDVELSSLAKEVRYLAVEICRYSGEAFGDMQCHAGWMVRDKVSAEYKSFDIKTVQNKFNLTGRAGFCVPLIVDLQTQEIIVTDLYMGSNNYHNTVEGAFSMVSSMSREIANFTETRPTLFDLAQLHLRARLGTASEREQADLLFGATGCTYNASDIEVLLSELL